MDEGDWEIDWEEAPDPELDGWDRGVAVPIMRATYAKDKLTVILPRAPMLNDGNLCDGAFDERSDAGISLIEFGETELEGFGWELTVGFLADGKREDAERAIQTWSSRVGYRRVWFPDRIYEPRRAPRVTSSAIVECPTCAHTWTGRGRRFWKMVWDARLFPWCCPLCGNAMPQWRVRRQGYSGSSDAERLQRASSRRRRERLKRRLQGHPDPDGLGPSLIEELDDAAGLLPMEGEEKED